MTFQGGKADVRKTVISASKVPSMDHVAVVDSNEGYIIPHNSTLTRKIQQLVQMGTAKELGAIRFVSRKWYVHRVQQDSAEWEHTKQSRIVLDACETTVGGLRHSRTGKSDGKRG